MSDKKDCLDKIKDYAQIFTWVAVPILVAAFGWWYQTSAKDREIARDYVQVAVGLLASKNEDKEVRTWAVELLNKNSPVPFGKKLQEQLVEGGSGFTFVPRSLAPIADVMADLPARQLDRIGPLLTEQEVLASKFARGEIAKEEFFPQLLDLLSKLNHEHAETARIADESRAKLSYLQDWARRAMGEATRN
ncbi:hypothetical protein SB816_21055 [Achromobacter sp. SIMBA_011]|uniref:hypothetical protein n=1 Tax=Achromobacter TaxID=222 RepID=UPI002E19D948|nr:hypothetical protein [Achromobacter xylosoxidans]